MPKIPPTPHVREMRTHRISFRLSDADYKVFCMLSERGGFQSLSSFLRYLAYCALRAQDAELTAEAPVAVLRVFRAAMDMHRETLELAARITAEKRALAVHEPILQSISEEIGDIFRECSADGARLTFPGDVNFRK